MEEEYKVLIQEKLQIRLWSSGADSASTCCRVRSWPRY
uniref:Uncharacterized protein n=1 Tax=Brassica oleracea TaxID=3712 RepID=A0A3P6F9T5_BRAOL|nr:unnamed protein product [Brassica oleracea]